jgi:hypothetical protein
MHEKMKWILVIASILACFKSAELVSVSIQPTLLQVPAKNQWATPESGRLHGSRAGGILRLRGGALYGASLTRWQHSDPSITEVDLTVSRCVRANKRRSRNFVAQIAHIGK